MSSAINPASDLAGRFWENSRLDDCPIYDFHGHMHEMYGGYLPAGQPEQMLTTMQRAGIKSFIFCSHLALYSTEIGEKANVDPVRKYGAPLHAYMAVQSYNLDFERDKDFFESHSDVYAGFKFLQDYFHIPLDAPCHEPYWRYANDHKLLCLCHTWGKSRFDGLENVQAVAKKYPDAVIICGHSIHGEWDRAMDLVREYPNVYLELTAVLDDRGVLDRFVSRIGSDRILFGTDLPWFSTHHAIGCILDAEMADEDRHNIFHRNGERLLARFPWQK